MIANAEVPIVRVTEVHPFAGGVPSGAVAVGQRADFKAILNNTAGNGPMWAPSELNFSNVAGHDGITAWNTWTSASEQTVSANIGDSSADTMIYVVSATIKSVTFEGPDYASVKQDTSGMAYSTPHFDSATPTSIAPVQYRRGARPTMDLVFEVLPYTYSGPLHIRALTTLGTSTNFITTCAGLAMLSGVQTTATLPDSVGYDNSVQMNWDYSVAVMEFYSAGASTHKIYRTLIAPTEHYHTSVDIACKDVTGTDAGAIRSAIWSKYALQTINNHNNEELRYWGTSSASGTLAGLLSTRDGTCSAWLFLLEDCWSVHGLPASRVEIRPPALVDGLACDAFVVYPLNRGQNGWPAEFTYKYHAILEFDDVFYDPSYGFAYPKMGPPGNTYWLLKWENDNIYQFRRKLEGEFDYIYDVKGVIQCRE